MKFLVLSFAAFTLTLRGHAFPSAADFAPAGKHRFIPPKTGDLRSPCPGLNTLANHGFLNRNGRDLTVSQILKAGNDGFNVQIDVIGLAAKIGLTTTTAPDTFTLDDIKLHGSIEHDASVSRADIALGGDNVSFNETLFAALAESNPGSAFYNTTSAGQVQKRRLAESQATNPRLTNTIKEFVIRSQESALYLSVMGDPVSGVAPKEFVNIFFREERLPIREGWTRPSTPITESTIAPLRSRILAASEWPGPNRQCSDLVLVVAEGVTLTT